MKIKLNEINKKESITNAQKTLIFFQALSQSTKNDILENISKHYQITKEEAYREVTHKEAESLLDYLNGADIKERVLSLMKKYKHIR